MAYDGAMSRLEYRLLQHINALWETKECLRCGQTTWTPYFGVTIPTRVADPETDTLEPARLRLAHIVCQHCGLTESINLDVVAAQRGLVRQLLRP